MYNHFSMDKNCHILQHGLCFFQEGLFSCCFSPADNINGQKPPLLFKDYKGELFSKEELFRRIDKYSNLFKNGDCPNECKNCYHIEEKNWETEKYIDYITISHFSICQANCIYCTNNMSKESRTNNTYKILPILNHLRNQGIIREKCQLHIGGGEFTIYDECEQLLKDYALSGFANLYVPTNAIKFSQALSNALEKGNTSIIVSLDGGSREMYKRVKRIDAFYDVVNNLVRYNKNALKQYQIALKYIILPTVNDNLKEFQKFLNTAKKIGTNQVIIDVDARYLRMNNFEINAYLVSLAEAMNNLAKKQNFETQFYSFLLQGINGKEFQKTDYFKLLKQSLKFKYFNKDINKIKELYKSECVYYNN